MVIAATLVMVIGMVFRIPYAFQGAIYALIVSRESSQATFQSAASILSMTGIGGAYLLASAWFVISIPTLHLLWVIASFEGAACPCRPLASASGRMRAHDVEVWR
jgi:hypothetical protein